MRKSRNAFHKAKGMKKSKACKARQQLNFHDLHSIITGLTGQNEWISNSELEARDQDYLVCPLVCPSVGVRNANHALLDSGASIHCTALKSELTNICCVPPVHIHLADDLVIVSKRLGTMQISISATATKASTIILNEVYYHPKFNITLISPGLLCSERLTPFTRLSNNRLALYQPDPRHQDYITRTHATFPRLISTQHCPTRTATPIPHFLHPFPNPQHAAYQQHRQPVEHSSPIPDYPYLRRLLFTHRRGHSHPQQHHESPNGDPHLRQQHH